PVGEGGLEPSPPRPRSLSHPTDYGSTRIASVGCTPAARRAGARAAARPATRTAPDTMSRTFPLEELGITPRRSHTATNPVTTPRASCPREEERMPATT